MKDYFKGIFGIIVFFIIIYFVLIDEEPKQEKSKNTFTTGMFDAKAIAENQVSILLKSPTTARFSDLKHTIFLPISGGYKVTGFVDSQNSFGALVRSYYSVEIYSKGGKYYYENLKFE